MVNLGRIFGCGVLAMLALLTCSQGVAQRVPGEWQASFDQNPMDGEKTITITQVTGLNGEELLIRCNHELDVFVANDRILDKNFERGYGSDVRIRFDREPAKRQVWLVSDDNKAAFSQSPRQLLAAMRRHKVFLFEYTPYEGVPHVAAFTLSGVDAELNKYYECRRLIGAH